MGLQDKRIDAYIQKSADFARPILHHLRGLVHKACPDVKETMKWSFPVFDYHGMLCNMAAFKHHCAFGFWKARLMEDYAKQLSAGNETAMGHFGQLKTLKDLPSDKMLMQYIREAARLNEDGVKLVRKQVSAIQRSLKIPEDLRKELARNKAARTTFEGFSRTNKKDYLEWITEAKTTATRLKRLTTTIKWLAEGKIRNWKYV